MEVQPQLVLLQKTLLNIEGMGRELYPDLDLWVTAKPFLQRWMDEQAGVRSLFNNAKTNLPKFIEQLPHMPVMINDVIKQIHDNQINMQMESKQLEQIRKEIKSANQRTVLTLSGSALLVTATLSNTIASQSSITWGVAAIGVILLTYGLLKK
jgi:ubiquinone biosynthesis protein